MLCKTDLSLVTAALSLTSVVNCLPKHPQPGPHKSYYPGWAGIKHIFSFGDSYTQTGFNLSLAQPSPGNPLGNPTYPGYTSSNGPNWIDYLTVKYNQSFVETINLAYGGATVDSSLVAPYLPTVLSIKDQVDTEYLPTYGSHPSFFPWTSSDTLFSIFIGVNDVGNSYASRNASLNAIIFAELAGLADQLYSTGARNFLFLNVPPVDRSPLTTAQGTNASALEASDIADWNARLVHLASNLSSTYPSVTSFVFDTHTLFERILDDPCSYPQTCPIKNTTDYCFAYENGTDTSFTFDASCGVSVDEYFWLNTLHPTFRVHDALASQIARELQGRK